MSTADTSTADFDRLRREFRFFAEMCAGQSPLYALLSSRAANDDEVLVIAGIPPDHLPCIFHSHTIYQTPKSWRERFADVVDELGRQRDVAHLLLEWLDDEPRPQLRSAFHSGGHVESLHLADCQTHGRWMTWLAN